MNALAVMDVVPLEHCPTLERLEEDVERVKLAADALLALARDELRHRQDAEAEYTDGFNAGARIAANRAAYGLRLITRQLTRAQCVLVHPDDERHDAARQVFRWADQADPLDAPWRDAA